MRPVALFALVVLLSACGAAAPPEPREAPARPGVSVSGDARIGVTATL